MTLERDYFNSRMAKSAPRLCSQSAVLQRAELTVSLLSKCRLGDPERHTLFLSHKGQKRRRAAPSSADLGLSVRSMLWKHMGLGIR